MPRRIPPTAQRFELREGVLYRRSFLQPWLRCVGPIQADYVLREIHAGSCSMHSGPRSVVAKALRSGYYWPTMHRDARDMIKKCKDCQVHRPIPAPNHQQELLHYHLTMAIPQWGIDIARPFPAAKREDRKWNANYSVPRRYNITTNDDRRIDLDILEERREQATIREEKAKSLMKGYHDARVRGVSFRPGDFVYRANDASHAEDTRKLGPKWEGPYEITEALRKGAYKLRDMEGRALPRTCNICNLRKCYL
ncbi:reverse transcriptase domain-containing protein [Tanacetum coccineum]